MAGSRRARGKNSEAAIRSPCEGNREGAPYSLKFVQSFITFPLSKVRILFPAMDSRAPVMPASEKEEAAPVSEATGAPEKREERKRKRRSGWEEQPAATPALPAPLAAAPDPPTAQAGLGLTPIQQEAIRAAQAMQAQAMQSGAPGDVVLMHAVAGSPPGQPPFVTVRKALRACWKSRSEVARVFALTCLYAHTHAAGHRESRGRGATVRGVAAL